MFAVKFSPGASFLQYLTALKFSLEGLFFNVRLQSPLMFFRGIKALSWIRSDNGRSLSVIMFHISVFLCVKVR